MKQKLTPKACRQCGSLPKVKAENSYFLSGNFMCRRITITCSCSKQYYRDNKHAAIHRWNIKNSDRISISQRIALPQRKWSREEESQVVWMREIDKKKWREIGDHFQIGASRVQSVYDRAKREEHRRDKYETPAAAIHKLARMIWPRTKPNWSHPLI